MPGDSVRFGPTGANRKGAGMQGMNRTRVLAGLVLGMGLAACANAASGPDVIVGDLSDVMRWGAINGMQSYSVGTVSCNIGDRNLNWIANDNRHPVIGQNLYRLKNGQFEQVGMSWLKHGFTALTQNLCATCSGQGGSVLGVGCSDPYVASLNGSQSSLGPRYQVNPYTGVFSYPVTGVPASGAQGRRLLVNDADVNPSLNSGARYFVEGQYVTQDDAQAGNGFNNTSYREVTFSGSGTNFPMALRAGFTTRRQKAAVEAWKEVDAAVTIVEVRIPNEGMLKIGYKVTGPVNGLYSYEYAIQNVNSDRAVGGVSMSVPGCDQVRAPKFHAPFYHSGEPYDNQGWTGGVAENTIIGHNVSWRTAQTFAENPNANALRWGTLYNFRFDSTRPPVAGAVKLDLFKPGTPTFVTFAGLIPRALTDVNGDGFIDGADYDNFVEKFEAGNMDADITGDNFLDIFDYDGFVAAYENGC